MIDALAFSGMNYMNKNLLSACSSGASNIEVRTAMAYGSLMSGITLANAGLGIVHGLAGPIGGLFDIPHGYICGTLLAEATKMNIKKLQEQSPSGKEGLRKYAEIGALLSGNIFIEEGQIVEYCSILVEILDGWTQDLKLERLGKYGIDIEDIERIVEKAGLKNNPVDLNKKDIQTILINRL